MGWAELGEMLHEPITQLTVLGVTLFYYCVCYSAKVVGGKRRTKKQGIDWSWQRFWSDVLDRIQAIYLLVALIIGADMTQWLAPLIGVRLDETVTSVVNASLIVAIPFISGLAELYTAAKNAFRLWGWAKNIKSLNLTDEDLKNITDENFEQIAETTGKFLETITRKTVREQLIEDGVDVEAIEGEIIGKGSGNTYPEPYRSAKKDSLVDPSTCYNREAQPAGTLITMADGSYKAVEDLKNGDKLFNHDGTEIVEVKSVWETAKPVYDIRTGAGDIRFTGEHPLYARRNRLKALARGNLKAFGDPQFVKTKDLNIGDKLFLPELRGEDLGLTENELRWLGFYLGDGTKASKSDNCPIYRLIVADGRKRDYVDSLNIGGSYSVHSHSDKAKYFTLSKKSHKALRDVLDTIDGKSFHRLVTPHDAKYIVEGYLMADGCHIVDNIYSVSSTDKKLLLAIQRMVLSTGGTMAIHKRYDEGELEKFGTKVYAKTLWGASVNLNPSRRIIHQFKDGKYATILGIRRGEKEKVYNIEVSGTHTYIAENYGVHNCVSYTAWKLCEINGSWPVRTGGMNAKYWVDRLPSWGYKMVSAPKDGGKYIGVLTSGTYGHVVWFEKYIDQATVQVSEYNYNDLGNYNLRNLRLLSYIWFEIQAPSAPSVPQNTGDSKGFKVGDSVLPVKYVDYDGKKLRKTKDYYVITDLKGDRAVLSWEGTIYAAVNTNNLKHVEVKAPEKPASSKIEKGDVVVPIKLVDYNGTPLVQYDPEYTVVDVNGDRAVLSARGQIWAAMNINNLRKK